MVQVPRGCHNILVHCPSHFFLVYVRLLHGPGGGKLHKAPSGLRRGVGGTTTSAINLLLEFIIPTEDLPGKQCSHKAPLFSIASEIRQLRLIIYSTSQQSLQQSCFSGPLGQILSSAYHPCKKSFYAVTVQSSTKKNPYTLTNVLNP